LRLVCDDTVRKAFIDAKQWYGAPQLADELPAYNVKTIAAASAVRGSVQRLPVSSARPAIDYESLEISKTRGTKAGILTNATRVGSSFLGCHQYL